jgi:hypothetical protein
MAHMPSKEDIEALKFLQATMRRTPGYQCADRGYWIGVKGKSKARSPITPPVLPTCLPMTVPATQGGPY